MWVLCIPGLETGQNFADHTSVFWFTNNNFQGGRNQLQLSSYKFMQNGEDIIDADDPSRKHSNSIDMQNTCYGNVKLHPHKDLNSSNLWDYPVAGSVLLCHPGHPHREEHSHNDVHISIPHWILNQNASEFEFQWTNNQNLDMANIWRGELHIVLEKLSRGQLCADYVKGTVEVKSITNYFFSKKIFPL